MEFMIGNGKLGGSIEYFYRKRDGLRGTRNDVFLPHALGYGLREENLNSDAHIGGEIALHYLGNAGELNYRIGGNFSFARSKHQIGRASCRERGEIGEEAVEVDD